MTLPNPPAEDGDRAACRSLDGLAPRFRAQLARVFTRLEARTWIPVARETMRSNARAAFLFGFGRTWDDGRGIVTNAATGERTWHHYGLAADLGDRRYDDAHTPDQFYRDLADAALAEDLTSGSDWNRNNVHDEHFCDRPHLQWFCEGMHVSPSALAAELLASSGLAAVWKELHADG